MIIVKIELASAISNETTEIGRMYITNQEDRSYETNGAKGDYLVAVCKRGTDDVPRPIDPGGPAPTRVGRVLDYPRLSYNVWRLIARALHATFPEEKTPNTKPVMSPEVLVGLRAFAEVAVTEGQDHRDNATEALAWLAAADPEDYK